MDGKRFLNSVKFTNLLSFGPEGMELELQPLNVLIGPNGSGKSNFIDAMRILQAITIDINIPFSKGDTVAEWLWKGEFIRNSNFITNCVFNNDNIYISYSADIIANRPRSGFTREMISTHKDVSLLNKDFDAVSSNGYFDYIDNHEKQISQSFTKNNNFVGRRQQYILQILELQNIRIYSDYEIGRYSKIRMPQNASLDPGDIFEGFGNLSLVINDLISRPEILTQIIEKMKIFYENVVNVNTRVAFGTIQIYLQELSLSETIPATRLSDGTIRFLSLLAILLHPEPPPLICLEEPEIGMHPDILSTIAELLIGASKRTQLIVTTHSDILLSAIGKTCPEAIVVCEKGPSGTNMTRPDPEQLAKWIEENSDLGNVWLSGLIGGNRW
ncbi:AAA family ATPase [Armatimonas sp.]|uniref:AAA family ATPase n=1 Tax=Armatimonas sp. TaxID=1872638 RepID=UPI0037507398